MTAQKAGGSRHRRKKKPAKLNYEEKALAFLACCSGLAILLGAHNLMSETGVLATLKTLLLGVSAGGIAYLVNRTAVVIGADYAARGYRSVLVASPIAIIAVGLGLFAASFSAYVITDVEELRLQKHGSGLRQTITYRNKIAVEAGRPSGVMQAIAAELDGVTQSELSSGAISGRGGGRGPITAATSRLAAEARQVAAQAGKGDSRRETQLAELNALMAKYDKINADSGRSVWDRRFELHQTHDKIDQKLALLDEAQGTAGLAAYRNKLAAGVKIPGRGAAEARLNAILSTQAATLDAVLGEVKEGSHARPSFPARAGVDDTMKFLTSFISIALVLFAIECVLPLLVFVSALAQQDWVIDRLEYADDVGGVFDAPNPTPPTAHSRNGSGVTTLDVVTDRVNGVR